MGCNDRTFKVERIGWKDIEWLLFRKQRTPTRPHFLNVHGVHHARLHSLHLSDKEKGPKPEGHARTLGVGAPRQHGSLFLLCGPGMAHQSRGSEPEIGMDQDFI